MSKLDIAKRLQWLRRNRWVKWCENMRVWTTQKTYEEMKATMCPICAKELKDPQIYFGEKICGHCKHDLDPKNLYDTQIKGHFGFKVRL